MRSSRRHFLRSATAMACAAPAYGALSACGTPRMVSNTGLVSDPKGVLDLPPGFRYQRLSETGALMDDGLRVPGSHDGMGAFAVEGAEDLCVLVRNHELSPGDLEDGPFGETGALPDALDAASVYDTLPDGRILPGGTTSLIYNVKTGQLEKSFLSLTGTERNCSGGITPWGSWLTCEETETLPGGSATKAHGYTFEVPSSARGLVPAVPLKAMGRFNHEAAAVDPRTGIVYQTEDDKEGLFYRFLPEVAGELVRGGKLQALVVTEFPKADTRNWRRAASFEAGKSFAVSWIDLEDVEAMETDLRVRGFADGAARFARGEGMAWAVEPTGASVYFACTTGGPAKAGQIWRYIPSPYEGTAQEVETPAQLVLHYESPDKSEMDMCDNIVAAPWGHLVVCEDGEGVNLVHGVAPDGRVYPIAKNAFNDSEFAGACFSPDGSTLFVNAQRPGITFAITGPWETIALA